MKTFESLAAEVVAISHLGMEVQSNPNSFNVTIKKDGSPVTIADRLLEKKIIAAISDHYPGMLILSEEGNSNAEQLAQCCAEGDYFSIDPLDGTTLFSAGLPDWTVSVALFRKGRPYAAVVAQPALQRAYMAMRGGGVYAIYGKKMPVARKRSPCPLIGLDLPKRVMANPQYASDMLTLMRKFGFPRNEPAVVSGIELMLGNTWAWVSIGTKHWDPPAGSLFIEECGGIAKCLDGSPIPWDKLEMPPLLFAESAEAAERVRDVLGIT